MLSQNIVSCNFHFKSFINIRRYQEPDRSGISDVDHCRKGLARVGLVAMSSRWTFLNSSPSPQFHRQLR